MPTLFSHYPARPQAESCKNAFLILCNAHDAASSFLDIFESVRSARGARGTPTDEEQDLLRAMLVFACAGLDSLAKQLVLDSLPLIIGKHPAAESMFLAYVEKCIRNNDEPNYKILASVIGDSSPRGQLIELYVRYLTSGSLQSKDAILKTGAAFDIRSSDLSRDLNALHNTFSARNQIVHEMDIDFEQSNRNRTPRAKSVMLAHANRIFGVAGLFLSGVDGKLSA